MRLQQGAILYDRVRQLGLYSTTIRTFRVLAVSRCTVTADLPAFRSEL